MTKDHYKIGTLIKDMGKIGIIYRAIEAGKLDTKSAFITWRFNYEIYYFDGGVTVMGHDTLTRLVDIGDIEIVEESEESEYFILDEIINNE